MSTLHYLPYCSTCRSHSNKSLCLAVVCSYRLNAPNTCMHARAHALLWNVVTNTSSYSFHIPYAQLSFHLTRAAAPLPNHHLTPSFHKIHGSSIPSAPSPHVHTAHHPLCHPHSLPDNTAARHPIIFMHTLNTHLYTAVHSALCWQRCLCSVSVRMHSSRVSTCFYYFIRSQVVEAGSP